MELKSQAKGAIIKDGFAERGFNVPTCDVRVKEWLDKVLA